MEFEVDGEAVVDGFMGYFCSQLFGDVCISTCPEDATPDMASWFPIYFHSVRRARPPPHL